jgi:hypothetical protein
LGELAAGASCDVAVGTAQTFFKRGGGGDIGAMRWRSPKK